VGVGRGRVGGCGCGHLGAQLGQLGIQRGGFLLGSGQGGITRGQRVGQSSQFLQRGLRGLRAGLGGSLPGCRIQRAGQ